MPALPGLLLIYGALSAGLAIATRLGDDARPGAHGLYGLLLGCWGTLAIIYGLLAVGGFHWSIVATIGGALAIAAHRAAPDAGRELLRAAFAEIAEWSWLAKGLSFATGTIVVAGSARAIGRPPLGWDAVTYHLVHAGRWVRDGAFTREHHPDAWAYYEYFPTGGDVLWALCMLGDGTTDYVFVGILLAHLLAGIGVYALMRAGGLAGSTAALGTSALMASSPMLLFAAWLYVDGIALGVGCATAATALLSLKRPSILGITAVSAGVTCAIAIKTNQIVLLGLIFLVLLGAAQVQRSRVALLAGALLPLALLMPEWVSKGWMFANPLYPFQAPLLGGGEPMLAAAMDGSLPTLNLAEQSGPTLGKIGLSALLILTPLGASMAAQLPAFALLLPVAAIGGARDLRQRPLHVAVLAVIFGSATLMFFLPSSWGLVTLWYTTTARFLLPAWAVVLLLTGRALSPPIAAAAFGLLAIGALVFEVRNATLEPGLIIVALGMLGVFAAVACSPLRTRPATWLAIGAAWTIVVQPLLPLGLKPAAILEDNRNPLTVFFVRYTPAREALADADAALVATDFAYDPKHLGHDAWRYWLMGRRSQHRLVTISRWRSGAQHPQWQPAPSDDALDPRAWRARLFASGADWLYVQGPQNPTWAWAASDPAFELIATTEEYNALFRVRAPSPRPAPDLPASSHGHLGGATLPDMPTPGP